MGCCIAFRGQKTWGMFFNDLLHPKRWKYIYRWDMRCYYEDLIYFPAMRFVCKYFGHVPVFYNDDEDCDCIICKRCRKILNR